MSNIKSKVIVITSGKGGVGKTTTSAAIGAELANRGFKTVVIDFDVGLRNLDLIMGCERRVIYDIINVINQEASLNQTLIKDKRQQNLYILPASQTRDKDALTKEGIGKIIEELRKDFKFIICDSPAGIERGALTALYFADEAIIVTNPEVSSVRDSDRIIGVLNSKTKLVEENMEITKHLLISRYSAARVKKGEMLSVNDVQDILAIPLLGIIPESEAVLNASNQGIPITLEAKPSNACKAYRNAVSTLLGEKLEDPSTFRKILLNIGLIKDLA
ncbi:MAG: septum site-determining protein MinD [Gammaproteobacteria bacterium]